MVLHMNNFKKIWAERDGFRDAKTIIVFVFAYLIAVVSNGFIDGFEVTNLISLSVGLGTAGIFGAVQTLTNEGASRGYEDAELVDTELNELIATLKKITPNIKRDIATDILLVYNQKELESLRKAEFERLKRKYEENIKVYQNRIDTTVAIGVRWFSFVTKFYLRRLARKQKHAKRLLSKLSITGIYVKYKPIDVDDIVSLDKERTEKQTEQERLRETPKSRTMRIMTKTNLAKTLFFFGLQGAAFASIFGRSGILWFMLIITFTLASTMITSYAMTKRFAHKDYKTRLIEKIDKANWLLSEQQAKEKVA